MNRYHFSIIFSNSFSGFGNVLAFKAITDEHIATIERCIRNDLYNYAVKCTIEQMHQEDQSILIDETDVLISDDQLIEYFGKLHASDPSKFHFQPGDVVSIREMVNYVKGIAESKSRSQGLKAFKYKQKEKNKQTQCKVDSEKVKVELIQRVIDGLRTRQADRIFAIDSDAVVNKNTVGVRIQKGMGVYGSVQCVICDLEKKRKTNQNGCFTTVIQNGRVKYYQISQST